MKSREDLGIYIQYISIDVARGRTSDDKVHVKIGYLEEQSGAKMGRCMG